MKKHLIVVLTSITLTSLADAKIPLRWTVETSRISPVQFDVFRGEEVLLDATLIERGAPANLIGNVAKLYWQTNGMGSAFWTASANVSQTNHLIATFTGDMDTGSASVSGFIGIEGKNYRAAFTLKFRHSPGKRPNELPLPARVIDFASVIVTNAPWITEHQPLTNYYTKAQTDARIVELAPTPGNYATVSNRAMNAVQSEEIVGIVKTNSEGRISGVTAVELVDTMFGMKDVLRNEYVDAFADNAVTATNLYAFGLLGGKTVKASAFEGIDFGGQSNYVKAYDIKAFGGGIYRDADSTGWKEIVYGISVNGADALRGDVDLSIPTSETVSGWGFAKTNAQGKVTELETDPTATVKAQAAIEAANLATRAELTSATGAVRRIVTTDGHYVINADLTADIFGFYDKTSGVWTAEGVTMSYSSSDSYHDPSYSYDYWYSQDRQSYIYLYGSFYGEESWYWIASIGGKYYSSSYSSSPMATELTLEGWDYDQGVAIYTAAIRSDYNRMGRHRIALASDATNAAAYAVANRPTTLEMNAAINAKAAYYVATAQLATQMKPVVAGWTGTNNTWNPATDNIARMGALAPVAKRGDLQSLKSAVAITAGQYQCCIMSNGTQVTYEMQYNDGETGNLMGRMLDVDGNGFSFKFNGYQKGNTNVVGSVVTNFLDDTQGEWEGTGILPTGFQPMVVVTFAGWAAEEPVHVDVYGPWQGNRVIDFEIQGDAGTPESVTLSNTIDFSPNGAGGNRFVSSKGLAHQMARQNKSLKTFWMYDLTNRLNGATFDLSTDAGKTAALTAIINALGGRVQ